MVKKDGIFPKYIKSSELRKFHEKLLKPIGINSLGIRDKGKEITFQVVEISYKRTGKIKTKKKKTHRTYDKWTLSYSQLKKEKGIEKNLRNENFVKQYLTNTQEIPISAGKKTYIIPTKALCITFYCEECKESFQLKKRITPSLINAGIENVVFRCKSNQHAFRFESNSQTFEEVTLKPSLIMRNSQNTLSTRVLLNGLGIHHPEIEDKKGNKITIDIIPQYKKWYIWEKKKEAKYDSTIKEEEYTKYFPRYKLLQIELYCAECDKAQKCYIHCTNLVWDMPLGSIVLSCKTGVHSYHLNIKTASFKKISSDSFLSFPSESHFTGKKELKTELTASSHEIPDWNLARRVYYNNDFREIIYETSELKYSKKVFLQMISTLLGKAFPNVKTEKGLLLVALKMSTFLPIKRYYSLMNLFRKWSPVDSVHFSFTYFFVKRLLRDQQIGKKYPIYNSTQLKKELETYRIIFFLYNYSLPLHRFHIYTILIKLYKKTIPCAGISKNLLNRIFPEFKREVKRFSDKFELIKHTFGGFPILQELIKKYKQQGIQPSQLKNALLIILESFTIHSEKRRAIKYIRTHLEKQILGKIKLPSIEKQKKGRFHTTKERIEESLSVLRKIGMTSLKILKNVGLFFGLWSLIYLLSLSLSPAVLGTSLSYLLRFSDIGVFLILPSSAIAIIAFGILKIIENLRKVQKL